MVEKIFSKTHWLTVVSIGSIIGFIGVVILFGVISILLPVQSEGLAADAIYGYLVVDTNPSDVDVVIDKQAWRPGTPVESGLHTIHLSAFGYDTVEYQMEIGANITTTLRGVLVDSTPPQVHLEADPVIAEFGEVITLDLALHDGGGINMVDIVVDGESLLAQAVEAQIITDTMELVNLSVGLHKVVLSVSDMAGNSASKSLYIEMTEPQKDSFEFSGPLPAPGESLTTIPVPQENISSVDLTDTVSVSITALSDVVLPDEIEGGNGFSNNSPITTIHYDTLSIPTYGYESALDQTGLRPMLDANKVSPPSPKSYEVVILENDALRLVFLPKLGGRLYQVIEKTTGRGLLYNNPVIKPTRWGPEDMNWWLAAGGMEWAFPVEEHGYAWGMPWMYTVSNASDGSGVITLSYLDAPSDVAAQVTVTLPPTGREFSVAPIISNHGSKATQSQMWISAAFPAGPGQFVDLPAQTVSVHSVGYDEGVEVGQALTWQKELGEWGRWQTWFSAFAAPTTTGVIEIHGAGDSPVLRREFDKMKAPGVKYFTWGASGDMAEFGGSPYFEVWGGLAQDFTSPVTLNPGEIRGWEEKWIVY